MGNLFERKVTKNGSFRNTVTTNKRTGKVSYKQSRTKSPSTKKTKK
jgi:hypothetical protein